MAFTKAVTLASLLYVFAVSAQNTSSIVQLPKEFLYLLPSPLTGINSNESFLNSTRTSDQAVNQMLEAANNAPITSFDPEFTNLVGSNPTITLVQNIPGSEFAFEGGAWIPEKNQAWFLSAVYQSPTHISILDLSTGALTRPNITGDLENPNGLWYDNGTMYSATFRNNGTYPGGVTAIDTTTLQAKFLTNSFRGRLYNYLDDLVVTYSGSKKFLFFTDLGRPAINNAYPGLAAQDRWQVEQNGGGVFRYDFRTPAVKQVLGLQDVAHPNGVRASPDGRVLYVTSNGAVNTYATTDVAANVVYAWDLTEDMVPVNKRLLFATPTGISDGIHVDDNGRIWTAEGDGVMVRSPDGALLGMFNAHYFQAITTVPIANFALAGDTLVIMGGSKLWTVKLNETVVSSGTSLEN